MKVNKLSFVIPCYGSEKTIESVVNGIIETVQGKNPFEIICVNDCSPDNVYSVLEKLAAKYSFVKVVNLAKNFGQHNALMAGFRHLTGDIVVCLDDDGQTDPKDCYKLINALNDVSDVIYAKYPEKKESAFRLLGSWTAKKMGEWLCDFPKDILGNSYFACKRFVIEEIVRYDNPYTYLGGLVPRATKKITNVEIDHHERLCGKSGYSLKKLISLWMNGFTAFSVKPLRISTIFGAVVAFVGFCYAIFIAVKKIINPQSPVGYSSIMCALLIIGGCIMLMLGMIGEYLGRMYICMNKAPQYVIRNTINIEDK